MLVPVHDVVVLHRAEAVSMGSNPVPSRNLVSYSRQVI